MSNYITTPSGDLIARLLIQRVSHIPNRGVIIKDSHNHMLAYIAVADDTLGIQVRDLFNDFVNVGRNAKQPDWSFLTQPAYAPAVIKASKPHKAPSTGTNTAPEA